MLTNPKPAGWTDDADTITAAQIGSIATQLPNALDAIGGGTYAPAADIVLSAGGGDLNLNCDVNHGGSSATTFGASTTLGLAGVVTFNKAITPSGAAARIGKRERQLSDGASITMDVSEDVYHFATPTAQRDPEVLNVTGTVPAAFETIWASRPATGNFSIIFHREGEAAAIVTLPGLTSCSAEFVYHKDSSGAGRWRLGRYTTGATAGADA